MKPGGLSIFDEENERYYVLENEKPKYLEVADILSDYAWGIKYVPDGEMIEPAYRRLAKRVLVNETRRDLEGLYDKELIYKDKKVAGKTPLEITEKNWIGRKFNADLGILAEIMARELLARITASEKLNFVVERADAFEDGVYKYDFKVRSLIKLRGVGVGDEEEINSRIKKLGIQFTISKKISSKRLDLEGVRVISRLPGEKLPVDDIVLCRVKTPEFGNAFDRWLAEGKPSGGPEQFLSDDIKEKLVQALTDRLFERGGEGIIYIKQCV